MMLLPLLAACAPPDAEAGSTLLVGDDIEVAWTDAYDMEDGVGGMFSLEVAVLDPDGRPAEGVRVEVTSGWSGAWVLPADSAHLVDDAATACASCEAWYDGETGRWYEVRPPSDLFGAVVEPRSAWLSATTDRSGAVPFHVFVDTAPDSGASVPVYASIAVATDSFEIAIVDDVVESLPEEP